MGKLLRVLSVIILLLSGCALALGILLFSKRELLKGRTQRLEKTLVELGSFLEARDAEPVENTFPAKDIDEVTSTLVDQPRVSDFWSTYEYQLEQADLPPLQISTEALMHYYKIDPITGKIQKDMQGFPITTGKGTMQAELERVLATADAQLNRLNKTRLQLQSLREEHVRTIEDLNSRKRMLRERLAEIVRLNAQIAELQGQVRRLEGQVQDLEDQVRNLQDEVALNNAEIARLNEELAIKQETIDAQQKRITELSDAKSGDNTFWGLETILEKVFEPGEKGKVVSVNADWSYVVLSLTDATMEEIANLREALAEKGVAGSIPPIDMFLKRGKNQQEFVSKIRLVQVKSDEKLAIADILSDWQRSPIQEGDIVFY